MNRMACVLTPDYMLASLCSCVLDRVGYQAVHAETVDQIKRERFALMLLDIDRAPLIRHTDIADQCVALTKNGCHKQRWNLLTNGGYADYVLYPFPPEELESKLHFSSLPSPKKIDPIGAWLFDRQASTLTHQTKLDQVRLSASECVLLAKLIDGKGRVCAPHQLLQALEEAGLPSKVSTLPVLINKLRQRLEIRPYEPRLILTVKTLGYRLNLEYSLNSDK
jgi:DNA-binding response OmpR family regulator